MSTGHTATWTQQTQGWGAEGVAPVGHKGSRMPESPAELWKGAGHWEGAPGRQEMAREWPWGWGLMEKEGGPWGWEAAKTGRQQLGWVP